MKILLALITFLFVLTANSQPQDTVATNIYVRTEIAKMPASTADTATMRVIAKQEVNLLKAQLDSVTVKTKTTTTTAATNIDTLTLSPNTSALFTLIIKAANTSNQTIYGKKEVFVVNTNGVYSVLSDINQPALRGATQLSNCRWNIVVSGGQTLVQVIGLSTTVNWQIQKSKTQ